jgi:Rap1a immunity proteins
MTRSLAAFLLTLTTIGVPAKAVDFYWTGNAMLEACRAAIQPNNNIHLFEEGECLGFFVGVSFVRPGLKPYACIPPEVTPEQMIRVVVLYFDQHPNRLHEDIRGVGLDRLSETWPCKQ